MSNNFIERLTSWQNYIHYILLGIFIKIVIWYITFYNRIAVPTTMNINMNILSYVLSKETAILILVIFITDTLIYAGFWFLPEPLRWRD